MNGQFKKYKNDEIVNGIRNSNKEIIQYIYHQLLHVVKRYVVKNSGDESSAEDIFQEAMIVLFEKIRKEELYLTCSFSTYFIAICKKLWLNQLRRKSYDKINYIDSFEQHMIFESTFDVSFENDFTQLFFKHFNCLSDKCQQVLILHFKKTPAAEIAIKLGFKNKEYAISRKYKCLKRLIDSIKSDPELKNIIVEDERIELF
ncbi:MAG: sigma-70 family RNA polymerase sigma factor [Bacteroidota bacterium]